MAGYQEGQRLQGSDGHIYVVRNGQPVREDSAAQMPTDPTFGYKGPQAAADIAKTQTDIVDTVADNRRDDRRVESQNRTDTIQQRTAGLPEGYMWGPPGPDGRPTAQRIPGYTSSKAQDGVEPLKLAQFRALQAQIDRVQELYGKGPGTTSGIWGIADYLPSDANSAFNSAAAGLGEVGLAAFRVPGVGSQSDAELRQFIAANTPNASDRDVAIQEKLGNLRRRLEATQTQLGIGDSRPNAMTMLRGVQSDPLQAAAFGATEGVADQYSPEMLQAHEALIGRLMMQGGGKLDPKAYAMERAKLNQQFGYAGDEQADAAWAQGINDYLARGGKAVPTGITPPSKKLSAKEYLMNSAVSNPLGAGAANYLDAAGMGGVSLLAGDKMQALNDDQPFASTLGQMAGAITGTSILGRGAGAVTGKVLPSMMGGARKAALARALGTDAAYSGVTGANQGLDPASSAAFGLAGSIGGRAIGRAGGAALGGVAASDTVKALRARGIPLTVGQTLGGIAKGVEDAATSVPLVGDMVGRRYRDSLRGLSTAAAEDVGRPIGYKPPAGKFGRELTDDVGGAVSDYYTNTVQGANVPLDGQYAADFAKIVQLGQTLPDDLRGKLALALNNRVNPINDAGAMTGETYQQAMRGLKGYKGEHVKAGFENDYRDALSTAQDALKGQMRRGGGAAVADGIDNADQAYRMFKTFEDATRRADGAGYLPTASQIQDAVKTTGRKYPGKNPLLDLADNAQEVLPSKLPDSGTARRLAQYGLGATALGGAQAMDSYGGTNIVNPYSLGAIALLTAGGTSAGQKGLVKALLDRPDALKTAGKYIKTKRGFLGRAMIPVGSRYAPDDY